jgi:ammonium transporter Rh
LFCSSKIKNEFKKCDYYNKTNYFSNVQAFLGMLFLFFFFPTFNSALCQNQKIRERGRINTYFSLFGSVISSFITSGLYNGGRFVLEQIVFGSISGALIISGCCTVCLNHWASVVIGSIGAIIIVTVLSKIKPYLISLGLQDICNTIIVHGLSGILGGLITPMFISSFTYNQKYKDDADEYFSIKWNNTNNTIPNDVNFNEKAGYQVASLFITLAIAFIGGIDTGYIMKISKCEKIHQYFTDEEFFVAEKENNDIFKYVDTNDPNKMYNYIDVEINNPSLFPKKVNYSLYNPKSYNFDVNENRPSYF